MQRTTEGAAPKARMGKGTSKQQIASLAHAKAHEVLALRAARERLQRHVGDALLLIEIDDMIREREVAIALMADEVAGHA